ncbi:signal peptidase I [Nevskia soli]|uniref:signal peptidase I n=1 Tax=Nevskia soli TaxID=418856 RepID=UPI0004A70799|nr:signal peptidase I [Nevskia soli]
MNNWIRSNRGFLAFLLLFGLFRTAIADWNPIPSGSMRPNLLEGDVVFVNRLAFNLKMPLTNVIVARTGEPRRGDIVTFFSPKNGTRLIKRVVGLPGDTVEMRDKVVIVNGQPATYARIGTGMEPLADGGIDALHLDESIGKDEHIVQWLQTSRGAANDNFGPLVIPADHFLMLGDNRDNSADFRYFGLVPRNLLIGRAVTVLVSADIKGNWAPRFERFGEKLD